MHQQDLALGRNGAESTKSQTTDGLFGLSSNMGIVDNTGAGGGNNSKNNDSLEKRIKIFYTFNFTMRPKFFDPTVLKI